MDHQENKKSGQPEPPENNQLQSHIETLELRCKRLRKGLRETQQKVRVLHSFIEDPGLMLESGGQIAFWNRANESIFGLSEDDVLGKNFFTFLVLESERDEVEAFYKALAEDCTSEETRSILISIRTKESGYLRMALKAQVIRFKDDYYLIGKFEPEKVVYSESGLLLNISQQIRSPMSAILGMVQLALNTQLTKEQREYLEILKSSADSLLTLFNDVLVFSKIESGLLDLDEIEFDLKSAVEKAVEAVATQAHDKGISIELAHPDGFSTAVFGDPGRFRQILVNILDYCVTNQTTQKVSVQYQVSTDESGKCSVDISMQNDQADVNHVLLDHLFNPKLSGVSMSDYRALRLPICKQLIELMKGSISIECPDAGGIIFHMTVRFKQPEATPRVEKSIEQMECEGLRVLHVDSSLTERMVMEEFITSKGMEYAACQHGQQALELLKTAAKDGIPFHILFTDTALQDMDGFILVDRIREHESLASLRIVFLASIGQRGDAARCKERGITAYLLKPVSQIELTEALKGVCQKIKDTKPPEESVLITRHSIREDLQNRNLKVLLLDDNPLGRKLSTEVLQKTCQTVIVPESAEDIKKQLRQKNYDLIFMDFHISVIEFADIVGMVRKLESKKQRIPIVVILDPAQQDDIKKCVDLKVNHYVTKPLKTGEVIQAIEDATENISDTKPVLIKSPLPKIPGKSKFNFNKMLKSFYGDIDLLKHAFKLFLEHHPAQLDAIRNAIDAGDMPILEKAAHDFQKSALNFGESDIVKNATILANASKNNNTKEIMPIMMTLETSLIEFINFVKTEIKRSH